VKRTNSGAVWDVCLALVARNVLFKRDAVAFFHAPPLGGTTTNLGDVPDILMLRMRTLQDVLCQPWTSLL
jgi:hypothetical protein